MVTKEDKGNLFNIAIDITKEFARSGSEKTTVSHVLRSTYDLLVTIADEIESDTNSDN